MTPPAYRLVELLREQARAAAVGHYIGHATHTLEELLDAAADRIEELEELENREELRQG